MLLLAHNGDVIEQEQLPLMSVPEAMAHSQILYLRYRALVNQVALRRAQVLEKECASTEGKRKQISITPFFF